MKGGQLIFNVVFLILIAVLFYLHFSSKNKAVIPAGHADNIVVRNDTNHNFRIAYFEMDSVTNSFSMVKEVKAELSREEERMNGEMGKLQKLYNDRLSQYQKQQMSQIQSEQANKDMLLLQQNISKQKQEMDQKYQDFYMRKMQEVKSRIEDFLKQYNKSKGYSYILSYEPGFIYYRDSTYNITHDLVHGLNELYKKK